MVAEVIFSGLSFTKEANKPRYSSFLEILAAESLGITIWSNADLLACNRTRKGLRLMSSPEEIAWQLADQIHQLGII